MNLNNSNLMAMFRQIKPSLEDAISHDIAQNNLSIAESIDADRADNRDYAQQLAKSCWYPHFLRLLMVFSA